MLLLACTQSGRRLPNSNPEVSSDVPNLESVIEKVTDETPIPPIEKNAINSKKPALTSLYKKLKASVFLIYTSREGENIQGTGFFVSRDGIAVSNYHVFESTNKGFELIETIDSMRFQIKEVIEKNKEHDYIIFRVDIGSYQISSPLPVSMKAPQIGEDVFAIGNPKGLSSTLSKGIVSSYRSGNTIIQTTAEITHGSSGGPLLNMEGEVVGITTAGVGEANLNFAINIEVLRLYRFMSF